MLPIGHFQRPIGQVEASGYFSHAKRRKMKLCNVVIRMSGIFLRFCWIGIILIFSVSIVMMIRVKCAVVSGF